MDRVYVYKDAANEWRWNRKSDNGRVIADSSEGYINMQDAIDMAVRVNSAAVMYVNDEPYYQLLNIPAHLKKENNVEQEEDKGYQEEF